MAKKSLQDSPVVAAKQKTKQSRVYRGQNTFDHDLYKLELGYFMRNRAFLDGDQPDWEKIEHVHHFHSIDSDGKRLTRCTAIAGHFHEMKLMHNHFDSDKRPHVDAPNCWCFEGSPATYECGPAMREVRRKVSGRMVKGVEALSYDPHTHSVSYVRSDRIELRKTNAEAVNVIAAEANKTAPLPGVIG